MLETAGRSGPPRRSTGPGRSISNGLTIPGFAEAHADRLQGPGGRLRRCAGPAPRPSADRAHAARRPVRRPARPRRRPGAPRSRSSTARSSAPCAHAGGKVTSTQTTASWVADLRGDAAPLGHRPPSAPCTSLFKPVRVDEPVDLGPATPTQPLPTPTAAWWRHERLHRLALRDHAASIGPLRRRARPHRGAAGWPTRRPPPTPSPSADAARGPLARRPASPPACPTGAPAGCGRSWSAAATSGRLDAAGAGGRP